MRWDAIVIGGGIVGASLAYHLAKEGLKTRLIDRHDTARATDAGAGILSPETSSIDSEDWYHFGVASVNYYQPLVANLDKEQDADTGYAMCGLLRLAVADDEVPLFDTAREIVFRRQQENQSPSLDDLHDIAPHDAQAYFPALGEVQKAFYHRKAARVDGRFLCEALIKAAVSYGLDVQNASVDSLLIENQQIKGVVVDGEEILAGHVAIAGGAWSRNFGEQLKVQIPVEPQRGQIIHLQLDEQDTSDWSILHPFRGHYMVSREAGRVIVGATRETGSGFDTRTSASGIRDVLDEALRVAPSLSSARLLEVRVGLRPNTLDSLPILGTVPNFDNIYLATGHGASGLQLAPYSGKLIADMMAGNPSEYDISPFHITRFL
ncbi:MAG: FAD-binding oxidoreductase [Phototrophicaceae bacterium]